MNKTIISMSKITIYTKTGCPHCHKAMDMMNTLKLDFEEINVDNIEDQQELVERTNVMSVPQIFIGKEFLGGYDELIELKSSGKLDQLLKDN